MRTIEFELSENSIDNAIRKLDYYAKDLQAKTSLFAGVIAKRVEEYAGYELMQHVDTMETLTTLESIHNPGSYTARVLVSGAAVWLEFGTGVVANPVGVGNYAHPKAAQLGMDGIGEYGHGHGADPNGWWYYDAEGRKHHTYGIPATMFMYHSAWNTRRDLEELARGVYAKIG